MRTCISLLFTFILIARPPVSAKSSYGKVLVDSLRANAPHLASDSNSFRYMNALATAYRDIAPDSGLAWAERELHLAELLRWPEGIAIAQNQTGVNLQNNSRHVKALEAYFKALYIYEELGDQRGISETKGNIGNVHYRQHNFSEALKYLNEALRIAEALHDKILVQFDLGYISACYYTQGKIKEALPYQQRALKVAEETGDDNAILLQTAGMANVYAMDNETGLSLAWNFKALRMAQQLGSKQREAIMLGNIGGNYYSATDTVLPPPDSLISSSRAVNYARCIRYLKQAVVKCREANVYDYISGVSFTLYLALEETGDYKGALAAYKEYMAVKDSLHNRSITENIAQLETKRQLSLKEKDIQLAKLSVAKKRNERSLFIVIIALLIALFAIIVLFIIQKLRSRQRLREEAIRQGIAKDLHDEIGSTISAINIYSSIAQKQDTQAKVLLQKINESSGKVMEAMGDIIWSINNTENDIESFSTRLREHALWLFDAQDINLHFDFEEDLSAHVLPLSSRKNIYLIFKEALNNAAKYAAAQNIRISLERDGSRLILRISDDGKGFTLHAASVTGNGLKNMKSRAEAIDAQLQIHSSIGEGTEIIVSIH